MSDAKRALAHAVEGILEINIDSEEALLKSVRFLSEPIHRSLVDIDSSALSASSLPWRYQVLFLSDFGKPAVDDMIHELHTCVQQYYRSPVTWPVICVSSFVKQAYRAVEDFFCENFRPLGVS